MLCSIFLPWGGHRDEVSYYEAFFIESILTGRWIHLGYLMMMHMISCCESMTYVLPYGHFLTRVFKDVGVDLSRETSFEAPNTYDMYDDQSIGRMKFEKALDGYQVRKEERALTQARGQGQAHPGVENEVEIREMEGGVDSQSGYQQKESELDIPPLQSKGVQFEATFSEPMLSELNFLAGPSTQLSFIEPSSGLAFIEPPYIEIPPHQAPLAPDHAPQMDLSTQISSPSTRMEELAVVSDTRFYSMEDHMDQYQTGFTSHFEYLQQRIERKDRLEHQHEKMMAYLCFVFLPLPPQL